MRKFYITNFIYLVLVVATVLVGCTHTVTETPTDTAPSKLDPKPVGVVSSESSAPAESTEESKGETSSQVEIGSKLDPEKPTAPAKDEKPATSTVQKPNKVNKPSNNVSSKPQNNSAAEEDEFLTIKHDIKNIEKLAVKYINEYRVAEGKPAATLIYGKAYQYAKLRSQQLVTDFSHDTGNVRAVAEQLKYGKYVELDYSSWEPKVIEELKAEGLWNPDEYSYWQAPGSEGIGMSTQNWDYYTDDVIARRIAKGYHDSPGHWSYIGGEKVKFITVGITVKQGIVYDCTHVLLSDEYN